MTFGTTVRSAREEAGYGLRELAERINISPAYLSRVETESIECTPSESLILSLASALGMNADELMRLAGRMPTDIKRYILNNPRVLKRLRQQVRRHA
jgi:transcriptional regulator with XRE-family HTH domain